ncbi:hypothetical protein AMEX_G2111 [Astyanax mexicanus]|uniref:Uncharacterized protein n=1 Tax=Astyanax mexicanus TaxID=7994 RepID=A0A8T2MNK7_ASTMX|nr:hypothetical protein AMEX_G2111 [Astyanax mexicanus]
MILSKRIGMLAAGSLLCVVKPTEKALWGPTSPLMPCGPGIPVSPFAPLRPSGPGKPWGPILPGGPLSPASPRRPLIPSIPGTPAETPKVLSMLTTLICLTSILS